MMIIVSIIIMMMFTFMFMFILLIIYRMGSITGTAKTLDLLRQNLQKWINKEIDGILQRYIDVSFSHSFELMISLKNSYKFKYHNFKTLSKNLGHFGQIDLFLHDFDDAVTSFVAEMMLRY